MGKKKDESDLTKIATGPLMVIALGLLYEVGNRLYEYFDDGDDDDDDDAYLLDG